MNFTKMQGAGNDFVVVATGEAQRNWSETAIDMCDRHFGIGADGLLLVLPSATADFRMRIFNPDGSEAEACGNGLRCLVRYIVDRGLTGSKVEELSVATISGIRRARLHYEQGEITKIQAGMGEPKFGADDIPVVIGQGSDNLLDIIPILDYPVTLNDEQLALSLVSMGNPHAVCFYSHPVSDFPLSYLGPKVERHNMFPNRTNFEVAMIINRQYIEARVWERGVGETLACGSGACAVAVAAQLHGYIDNRVDVKLPGGILEVEWHGSGEVLLSGPTQVVFSGDWPE